MTECRRSDAFLSRWPLGSPRIPAEVLRRAEVRRELGWSRGRRDIVSESPYPEP